MSKRRLLAILASLIALSFPALAISQDLRGALSPEVIAQLQSLSPEEQRRYAQQYGISLPQSDSFSPNDFLLAAPGETLSSATDDVNQIYEIDEIESEVGEASDVARFGRDVFRTEISTFAPTDNAPVPNSYRLGVGDHLDIQLFGKENDQFELQIGRSGEVLFPRLGPMTLSGLSLEDARALITSRVAEELIGVNAVVGIGRLRAINIFMAGEVLSPGAYSVSALTTITQAIYQAGGISEIGSLRSIEVRRNGSLHTRFDAYELLLKGNSTKDINLVSGDVVYVPPFQAEIKVTGSVKRPRIYELLGGENIADIIEMSGSFGRGAYAPSSLLTRYDRKSGLKIAISVDLTSESDLQFPVNDGDEIFVPEIAKALTGNITVTGAVSRPGTYGWVEGTRLTDILGDARRDLLPDSDLGFGLIVRQKNELLDIEVIAIRLDEALRSPGSPADLVLAEFDEIIVFSLVTSDIASDTTESSAAILDATRPDAPNDRKTLLQPIINKLRSQARQNEPVQVVSVSGAVRAPGTYPLTKGASINELIGAAGGLTDSAFLESAELRRIISRSGGEIDTQYREVDLTRRRGGIDSQLLSRDHLTVRNIPDWSPSDVVAIEGEVKFPGEYRITKNEKLSDVIRRAGGLTEAASSDGAVFTRVEIADLEKERAAQFKQEIQSTYASKLLTEEGASQGISEITNILAALDSLDAKGRLLIDLSAALAGDEDADLIIRGGDRLTVPERSATVTVVGEVQRAGTHTFRESLSLEDYIELSAGVTQRADSKGIYIVKANGSVITVKQNLWRFTTETKDIDPGDTVVVPINTQYKDSLANWREVTQVLYQSVVSIAAVARL